MLDTDKGASADIILSRRTSAHSTAHILAKLRLLRLPQPFSNPTRRHQAWRTSVMRAMMKHTTKTTKTTKTKTGWAIIQTA